MGRRRRTARLTGLEQSASAGGRPPRPAPNRRQAAPVGGADAGIGSADSDTRSRNTTPRRRLRRQHTPYCYPTVAAGGADEASTPRSEVHPGLVASRATSSVWRKPAVGPGRALSASRPTPVRVDDVMRESTPAACWLGLFLEVLPSIRTHPYTHTVFITRRHESAARRMRDETERETERRRACEALHKGVYKVSHRRSDYHGCPP